MKDKGNPIIKRTAFGDNAAYAFTGVTIDYEQKQIMVYLRCRMVSKANDLNDKIDNFLARGKDAGSLSDADKLDLANLMIESKTLEEVKNQFVAGSAKSPTCDRNVMIFDCRYGIQLNLRPIIAASAPALRVVLELLDRQTPPAYTSFNQLVKAFTNIVENNRAFRWIETLDAQGYGTYI